MKKGKSERLAANEAILARLAEIAARNPDWRFHQLLQNARVEAPGEDRFYEESAETLRRMNGAP